MQRLVLKAKHNPVPARLERSSDRIRIMKTNEIKTNEIKTTREAVAYYLSTYSDLFTEAYAVGDSLEIVAAERIFRIDIKESLHTPSPRFDVNVSEKSDGNWKEWGEFPWCNRSSKSEVVMQALSFLCDRLRK